MMGGGACAALARQLSVLFNEHDDRIFDSIIVVTDRRILDKQLQEAVLQFEQSRGVVENIDTTSSKLKDALENGKTIIVTTLQKFPQIVDQINALEGKHFAVIIDEAHSSQSGESSGNLKQVLTVGNLDAFDMEESEEGDDLEDRIAQVMRSRTFPKTISFFAFTATPKPKTLSRLNRVRAGKEETMVLDFANEADEIQQAFAPYYERTLLSQETDPNLLYDLQGTLEQCHFYSDDEVNRFAALYFDPKGKQDKLYAALAPVVDRYQEATEGDRANFRGQLRDYVRLYAFLAQLLTFIDTDLEKLAIFGRFLLRRLPNTFERLPVEIQQNIDIESFRVRQTTSGKIQLPRGVNEVDPIGTKEIYSLGEAELEPLSQIIRELNEHFGTEFDEEDKLCIRELEHRLVVHRLAVWALSRYIFRR